MGIHLNVELADPGLEALVALGPLGQPLLQRPHHLLPLRRRPLQRVDLLLRGSAKFSRKMKTWKIPGGPSGLKN